VTLSVQLCPEDEFFSQACPEDGFGGKCPGCFLSNGWISGERVLGKIFPECG